MSEKNQIKFHAMCIAERPQNAWFHVKGIVRAVKSSAMSFLAWDRDGDAMALIVLNTGLLVILVWVGCNI